MLVFIMVILRGKYMKKIVSVILFSFLAVMGNIYAQTYYTGDGGRNITLAVLEPVGKNFAKEEQWILPLVQGAFNTNFNKYSAINIVDRQNLDKILAQQRESASGNYSDADYINIGKLANARHILIGTITKTPNGSFMLEFSVSEAEAGKRVASYGPKPSTMSALENLSAIQEASADLLDQLGVKLTDAGKRSLSSTANDQQIQAETALSKGIVAQKSGTAIEAFAYYLQAVNYNPSSAEIVSRLDIVNADITSSSMGEDIRNAIAWRKAWVGRLSECDQFVVNYVKKTPLTTTLVYSADFKQGEIDWDKETIPISVDVCLTPSESWPVPITGVVNAVYEGFAGTGQAATWKLDWPLKSASGGASQVMPVTEVKYNLVLDLLNDKGAVLGRQGVTFTAGWKIEFRDGKSVGVKTQTPQTVTYPAVDANKISETLAIRIASINGRIVSAGVGNSVAVQAMTGADYEKTVPLSEWVIDLPANIDVVFQTMRAPIGNLEGFFAPDGVNPRNFTGIHLWDMKGNEINRPHRLFRLEHLGDGWYRIRNNVYGVVDIPYDKNENGVQIVLYGQNNGDNQRFRFRRVGYGIYQIYTHWNSNFNVSSGKIANGTSVVTWVGSFDDPNPNAQWRIYTVSNGKMTLLTK